MARWSMVWRDTGWRGGRRSAGTSFGRPAGVDRTLHCRFGRRGDPVAWNSADFGASVTISGSHQQPSRQLPASEQRPRRTPPAGHTAGRAASGGARAARGVGRALMLLVKILLPVVMLTAAAGGVAYVRLLNGPVALSFLRDPDNNLVGLMEEQ